MVLQARMKAVSATVCLLFVLATFVSAEQCELFDYLSVNNFEPFVIVTAVQ